MSRRRDTEDSEQFIERKIIIGMITNDSYLRKISLIYKPEFLKSQDARMLAAWVLDHHQKYGRSPSKNIEGIFIEKLKAGLDKERAEGIESIITSLSKEYESEGGFDADYWLDQTIRYFKTNQAQELIDEQIQTLRTGNLPEFYRLHQAFKPVTLNEAEEGINAKELYLMTFRQSKWLIKDLLPIGLTIVGGKSKVGKSYFLLNIAMALSQSRYMFGDEDNGFKGQGGKILYLSLEDDQYRFADRMREIDMNPDLERLKNNLIPKFSWTKLNQGGLQDITNWVEKAQNPRLIIIDTLAKLWSKKSSTPGGGLYAEEYSIFGPLADLAHRHSISIIVVIHTTKNQAADVFDEILGGMGTQGPADNLIVLTKDPFGDRKRVSIRGKDISECHLAFETPGGPACWIYLGEAGNIQKTAERQDIIDVIRSKGGQSTVAEIREGLKEMGSRISPNSLPTILQRMLKQGIIGQCRRGRYELI